MGHRLHVLARIAGSIAKLIYLLLARRVGQSTMPTRRFFPSQVDYA